MAAKITLLITMALIAGTNLYAAGSFKPEVTVPLAEGPLTLQDLGPVYTRPLPPSQPPAPPKTEENPVKKKTPLFSQQEELQQKEEKNPLEEEARKELKALENAESPPAAPTQEIDLNNPTSDSKDIASSFH